MILAEPERTALDSQYSRTAANKTAASILDNDSRRPLPKLAEHLKKPEFKPGRNVRSIKQRLGLGDPERYELLAALSNRDNNLYAIVQNTEQAQAVIYMGKCIYVLEQNDALQHAEVRQHCPAEDKHPAMLYWPQQTVKALAARLSVN